MDVAGEADVRVELYKAELTGELFDGFYGPAGHGEGWHHYFEGFLDDCAGAVGYSGAVGEFIADFFGVGGGAVAGAIAGAITGCRCRRRCRCRFGRFLVSTFATPLVRTGLGAGVSLHG